MRVTKVAFVDWIQQRVGRVTPDAVLPPTMCYWQPEAQTEARKPEDAPPVPEPNKGVYFDAWA